MVEEEQKDREEEEQLEGDVPAEREASLLNLRTLIISVAGLVGMIVFIHLFAGVLFGYYRSIQPPGPTPVSVIQPPVEPGLQVAPADDLLKIRATEQARLQGYGWIDQDEGVVHIPIERAMEILAESGLPVVEGSGEREERIDARESGFPHPSEIPAGNSVPQSTPLLEITLPADSLESPTPNQDTTQTSPREASTPSPDLSGTPAAAAPVVSVSHGTGGQTGQIDLEEDVGYDQNLDNQLPLNTTLVNEEGQEVRIGNYFNDKPVILVFAYYECPMLCTLVLNELTRTMVSLDFDVGKQFEVITISIDPRETYDLAYGKKMSYLNSYDRPGAEQGWHFLTGGEKAIETLTNEAGFRYVYDDDLDQYAHPAGVLILTPAGRIARYLSGLDLSPRDLRLGLVEASEGRIGTAVDQFFLLCYAYDPVFGRYSLVIKNVLMITSIFTVLLLVAMVSFFLRVERRKGNSLVHKG